VQRTEPSISADIDFGRLLHASGASGASLVLLRRGAALHTEHTFATHQRMWTPRVVARNARMQLVVTRGTRE
jgi:hypothetical protein